MHLQTILSTGLLYLHAQGHPIPSSPQTAHIIVPRQITSPTPLNSTALYDILYRVAYASAGDGMAMAFTTFNAIEWCATQQLSWCPRTINGTMSTIAHTAVRSLRINFDDCDSACMLMSMCEISAISTISAIRWSERTLEERDFNSDCEDDSSLRKAVWLMSQEDRCVIDAAKLNEAVATGNVQAPAPVVQDQAQHDDNKDLLPILLPSIGVPAILTPFVVGGVCVADPLLCNGKALDFLRRFFTSVKDFVRPEAILSKVIDDAASSSSGGSTALEDFMNRQPPVEWPARVPKSPFPDHTPQPPLDPIPEETEIFPEVTEHIPEPPLDTIPGEEEPVDVAQKPEDPPEPPQEPADFPNEPTQQPHDTAPEGLKPQDIPTEGSSGGGPGGGGTGGGGPGGGRSGFHLPEWPGIPFQPSLPNLPSLPIGPPSPPSPPFGAPMPFDLPIPPPGPPIPPGGPPLLQPSIPAPVSPPVEPLPPPRPIQGPSEPPIGPPSTILDPVDPVPLAPEPDVPEPPAPENPTPRYFRGPPKYDVHTDSYVHEDLMSITSESEIADIYRKAGSTFSSTKDLPYKLLDSSKNPIKTVWRDPSTLDEVTPEAPVSVPTGPAAPPRIFQGPPNYDVHTHKYFEELLQEITTDAEKTKIYHDAAKTFSSSRQLPYKLLDEAGNPVSTVWRDPRLLHEVTQEMPPVHDGMPVDNPMDYEPVAGPENPVNDGLTEEFEEVQVDEDPSTRSAEEMAHSTHAMARPPSPVAHAYDFA